MKNKPNFTYREFIQKISNVQISNKEKLQERSSRALKSQNKNTPFLYDNNIQKPSLKNILTKQNEPRYKIGQRYSPRHTGKKKNQVEMDFLSYNKSVNLKNTTNNKLKLRNQTKLQQVTQIKDLKHNKSLKESLKGNFYPNQFIYLDQRHNQSCSIFQKNYNYNQQEKSTMNFGKNPSLNSVKNTSLNSKLKVSKQSNSIDSKIKVAIKQNHTDRKGHRINTQYEYVKRQQDHLHSQYEKVRDWNGLQSPSFYRKQVDQASFLECNDGKSHKTLFPERGTCQAKKSTISLQSSSKRGRTHDKSDQLAYNKFICTISQILFKITRIQTRKQLLTHKIKYIQYLQSLKELKMIRNDYEPYSQHTEGVDSIRQLWEQLIAGHNMNHFIVIVAILLKVTPLDQVSEPANTPQIQNYVFLQRKYAQFRFTRLELNKPKAYSQMDALLYYDHPFKPTLNKNSQQIASRSRSQKKYKINASTNHNQSVNLTSRRQNGSISTQFQNIINQNQSVTSPSMRGTSPLGNKRSEMLYKQAAKKSLQKRENKSTIDYQYEKNAEQLTFKPKITIRRKRQKVEQSNAEFTSPRSALDQQRTINRMIRGRIERQVKQITIDKGFPYNQKMIQKLRRQKYQQFIKQQNQSKQKTSHKKSKVRIKVAQAQCRANQSKPLEYPNSNSAHYQCTDDLQALQSGNCNNTHNQWTNNVQTLESILDLSFQQLVNAQNDKIQKSQYSPNPIQSSPLGNCDFAEQKQENLEVVDELEQFPQDYFILDIYFEQDRSEKLLIKRDSKIQQVNAQAQRFVRKHNLPFQMQHKLKQELTIAMKFHDIERIQENAEQQECSLLL